MIKPNLHQFCRIYQYTMKTTCELSLPDLCVLEAKYADEISNSACVAYFKARGYSEEATYEFIEQFMEERARLCK